MPVDSPPPPDWLVWAAGLAIAACLGVAATLFRRQQRGQPAVDPRPHRPVPWEGSDVVLVVLAFFLMAVGVGSFLGGGPAVGAEPPLDLVLAGNLLLVATATLLAGGWLVARGSTPADLGLASDRPEADVGLAFAALALVVAPLLALAGWLNRLVPYEHPVVAFLAERRDFRAVLLVVLTAVVAAPLAEEFFFRRVLQGWLEKRLPARNAAGAIVVSAAAFALAHQGQGLAFVPLFPLGLVLGYLVRQTGSLLPAILLHALFNAVSIAILLASPLPFPQPS
jgi:membrane protease YdiL (CAAX protease family)